MSLSESTVMVTVVFFDQPCISEVGMDPDDEGGSLLCLLKT